MSLQTTYNCVIQISQTDKRRKIFIKNDYFRPEIYEEKLLLFDGMDSSLL